ncbi:MAG: hypothetical protein ABH851_00185, partial [Methanobacteriota archaeon]
TKCTDTVIIPPRETRTYPLIINITGPNPFFGVDLMCESGLCRTNQVMSLNCPYCYDDTNEKYVPDSRKSDSKRVPELETRNRNVSKDCFRPIW